MEQLLASQQQVLGMASLAQGSGQLQPAGELAQAESRYPHPPTEKNNWIFSINTYFIDIQ